MARRKKKPHRSLRGTPEQHQSAAKRMAETADDHAQLASKFAREGNCKAAIINLHRMGKAEGAAQAHYEQFRQTLPVKTVGLTKAATDTVHRICSVKT